MIIRVIEHPLDHHKRRCIYNGCADEFSKQSDNPRVKEALNYLKHSTHLFTTVRTPKPDYNVIYFIERVVE